MHPTLEPPLDRTSVPLSPERVERFGSDPLAACRDNLAAEDAGGGMSPRRRASLAGPMQHMDWDDFRVFLDVARARSMTRAAQALGVDHSAVSRRLSRLEYAVGAALFERGRDGVRLTETGVAVLRRAEKLAAGIGNLRADLAGSGAVGGTVRLATMEGIASLWLAPRLAPARTGARPAHGRRF